MNPSPKYPLNSKLSTFFFSLAGITLLATVSYLFQEDSIVRNIARNEEPFLLFVSLFLFSSLGSYFASRQPAANNVNFPAKPAGIDWPFYMMALGFLLPLADAVWGPKREFGALIVMGLSIFSGIFLIVSGAVFMFVRSVRTNHTNANSGKTFTISIIGLMFLALLAFFFFYL